MKKLAKISLFIVLPLVIVLLSFESVAFDTDLFLKKINDYGVFEQLDKKTVEPQVKNLVEYLKGDEELEQKFYSNKEVLHLKDVNKLFFVVNILSYVFYILIIIILFHLRRQFGRKEFLKTLFQGSLISFGFYIVLLLILLGSFDKIFYYLHTVLFSNDYWMLDPSFEYLVIIFPAQFFIDISQLIFAKTIIISLLTAMVSLTFFRFNKIKHIDSSPRKNK